MLTIWFYFYQDGLLNSDHRIKIASLPSPAMSLSATTKIPPLKKDFNSTIGKLKPLAMGPMSTVKPVVATSGQKSPARAQQKSPIRIRNSPIRLRPSSRTGINTSQKVPVKVLVRPD